MKRICNCLYLACICFSCTSGEPSLPLSLPADDGTPVIPACKGIRSGGPAACTVRLYAGEVLPMRLEVAGRPSGSSHIVWQSDCPELLDVSGGVPALLGIPPTDTTVLLTASLPEGGSDTCRFRLMGLEHCSDPLSRNEAAEAAAEVYRAYRNHVIPEHLSSLVSRTFREGDFLMPFECLVYGRKPRDGRSLYLSLHGGGGAPKELNDQQWENQKRLYRPEEGVYIAPRAAVDAWNMWHQEHVDALLDRMIRMSVTLLDVNPDKVYLMGYSAGGDGVYQLAPRMADRWAAASMMAGHPGDAVPDNLRNVHFSIWVGGEDAAYDRNHLASRWGEMLDDCRRKDPAGYLHDVHVLPGKGHWMDREDAAAVGVMAACRRNPYPDKVVWQQDEVVHDGFYWLTVPAGEARKGMRLVVSRKGNVITVEENDYREFTLWLNDRMVDLDRPVTVVRNGRTLFTGILPRTRENLYTSMQERKDAGYLFPASLTIRGN